MRYALTVVDSYVARLVTHCFRKASLPLTVCANQRHGGAPFEFRRRPAAECVRCPLPRRYRGWAKAGQQRSHLAAVFGPYLS